jgi:hypothetical protein
MVIKMLDKYDNLEGWRKLSNWRHELKGMMRELGKANGSGGKNKEERIKAAAKRYLAKARLFDKKLKESLPNLPMKDAGDLATIIALEHFMGLMEKHIDLVDRRIIKGEIIPHQEKMFSIFETYTEMVKKGKLHPNVELGKKLLITTDQYNLILDYQILHNEQDRDATIGLADRVLSRFTVESWSYDKGFWSKVDKELLQLSIPKVIMPKLGKLNQQEEMEQNSRTFKRLKNKHSAIESNINELENRGLDRCPERGIEHFKRYIGLGVCAYNLKKIGRQILKAQRIELESMKMVKRAA